MSTDPHAENRQRLEALLSALGGAERLLILPHSDPDPDAIASALGLKALVQHRLGTEVDLVYRGIIGRAENQAMVRYLGYPLRPLVDADLRGAAAVALIDTQPGSGNNVLPPGRFRGAYPILCDSSI